MALTRIAARLIATPGVSALNGGLRGATGLFIDKQRLHHRLEIRAQTLLRVRPAAEGWLLSGVSFDPQRWRVSARLASSVFDPWWARGETAR